MKTDDLIDLAKLGLTAFIIFTLVKSFQGLADWLGGAGETIKKSVIEPIQKTAETTTKTITEIGSGMQKEVTKPIPIYPMTATSKAEEFGMTVAKFVTQPPPLAFATTTTEMVLKHIFKPKKVTPKPKPKPESKKITPSTIAKYHVARAGLIYLWRKRAKPSEYIKFFKKVQQLP